MTKLKINNKTILSPGDTIKRKDIHLNLGGEPRGGISTWADGASTFLFSGIAGEESGYFDGWNNDVYEYYGQGSIGDMKMARNNLSLLNHQELGRKIYLFKGTGGNVMYENEFYIDSGNPFFNGESVDKEGNLREAIVFRLKPIKNYSPNIKNISKIVLPKEDVIKQIPLEKSKGGKRKKQVKYVSYTKDNHREAALVEDFNLSRLKVRLNPLERHSIQLAGTDRILRTDGWAKDSKTLIEAKASVERDYIRMAIGQLFDYKKLLDKTVNIKKIAVLTPKKPSDDLLELLDELGIQSIYKKDNIFIYS